MPQDRGKNLAIVWTSHLPKESQEAFGKEIRNSTRVLGRLRDIVIEKLEALERDDNPETYEADNPLPRLAHSAGRRNELKDLLRLLSFF